ncbi:hypothetical protein BG006_003626 [Podila minutissima]|uniref:Uncharacterized protein n=1 Tax=Podila minutissima TaxID=64525 RepID=A0A9P5S911_9FUNG|nr:hypothetical protein BG006_003626 [Podila minutissima]
MPQGEVTSICFQEYTEEHHNFGLGHSIELIFLSLATKHEAILNACTKFGTVISVKMGTNPVHSMATTTVIFEDLAAVAEIEKLLGNMLLIGNDSGCVVHYGTKQMGDHICTQVCQKLGSLPPWSMPKSVTNLFAQVKLQVDSITMPVNLKTHQYGHEAFVTFANDADWEVTSKHKW